MRIIIVLCFISFSIKAQYSLKLHPTKDNTVYSENPDNSNGAGNALYAGKTLRFPALRRALLQFDFSAIPSNAVITDARLELYIFKASQNIVQTNNFAIHKLNTAWGEGTAVGTGQGAPASTGDATWSKSIYPNTDWTTPGGDFVSTATATTAATFSYISIKTALFTSAQMISDIYLWRTTPLQNYGWILLGDEQTSGSVFAFMAKDIQAPYTDFKPSLFIEYTVPENSEVFINEFNPLKKRIELYNPSNSAKDVGAYSLSDGINSIGLNQAQISLLKGNLTIPSKGFLCLKWPDLPTSTEQLALYNASNSMIDYLQINVGGQSLANAASNLGLWSDTNDFLPANADSTLSYSVKTNEYNNGTATSLVDWHIIEETPGISNVPCPSELILSGIVVPANYKASASISLESSAFFSEKTNFYAPKITLKPNVDISTQTFFQTFTTGCIP